MNRVGIITFHGADDHGAMLQAYGLKSFLRAKLINADIVRYEPFFMTGRYWWFPYIPVEGLRGTFHHGYSRWRSNLKMGKKFFKRRRNMKCFRETYLVGSERRKLHFRFQLKRLAYQYYIVGSDQIWNPFITYGLKKVYFGNFKNKCRKKVVAYAASIGGAKLSQEYDKEFSDLIQYVDVVSVREKAAISYVEQFYSRDVSAFLDPVFLLKKEEWMKIERLPDKRGYIFVYITEQNQKLFRYVKDLSRKKGIPIVRVRGGTGLEEENVLTDFTAGPAEFLGYIHNADYIVTNSFHGIAFSIIYQKRFIAFQHSSLSERLNNILALHGLEDRIYRENENTEIECNIEWDDVKRRTEENVYLAEKFLLKHLG